MAKKLSMGPKCPKCGGIPYDIVRMEKDGKGPAIKKTMWYCPSVVCNPMAEMMANDEVWG